MRKMLLLVVVLATMGMVAQAQDLPKFEFGVTYNLFVADIDVLDNEATHGYGLSLAWNANSYLALVAEWTAAHGASGPVTVYNDTGSLVTIPEVDTRFQTFLGGPRLTLRKNRFNVFGHWLVGMGNMKVEDETANVHAGNGEFAMALGGGVDIYLGKKVSLRAAQFDWVPIHTDITNRLNSNTTSADFLHNTRFQTGLVFRFGTR